MNSLSHKSKLLFSGSYQVIRPRQITLIVSLTLMILLSACGSDGPSVERVKAIGPEESRTSSIIEIVESAGLLYIVADTAPNYEIWVSDGTAENTYPLDTSHTVGYSPSDLVTLGEELFFSARAEEREGNGLWRTDGTRSGTVEVFQTDQYAVSGGARPRFITRLAEKLVFTIYSGGIRGVILVSDGTAEGTKEISTITTGSDWVVSGGHVYFARMDQWPVTELWKTDGTEFGTVRVSDVPMYPGNPTAWLTDVDGTLFFVANDGTNGSELWRSDGTSAGTYLVRDIRLGPDGSNPKGLIALGGMLLFSADNGVHGRELWRSDGTLDGTFLVSDIHSGPQLSLFPEQRPAVLNQHIYFQASDGDGVAIWASDGSEEGTRKIRDMDQHADSFTTSGDRVFFVAKSSQLGTKPELWYTDGTSSGTRRAGDLGDRYSSSVSRPVNLTDVDGTLFFSMGTWLWKVD